MYLVLELPAERLPRYRRGKTEQDATIRVQRTRAKIVNVGEKLRSDPMILLTQRDEMADRARLREIPAPRMPRPDSVRTAV